MLDIDGGATLALHPIIYMEFGVIMMENADLAVSRILVIFQDYLLLASISAGVYPHCNLLPNSWRSNACVVNGIDNGERNGPISNHIRQSRCIKLQDGGASSVKVSYPPLETSIIRCCGNSTVSPSYLGLCWALLRCDGNARAVWPRQ